jgi:hypothetical protein
MVKARRLLIAGAGAISLAIAPMIVLASPAPRTVAAPRSSTLSSTGDAANAGPSGRTSTGHLFGKAVSTLAHQIPAGPAHGALISQFATNNNPSNFHIHKAAAAQHKTGKAHADHGRNAAK